jgi:hypothetical protein
MWLTSRPCRRVDTFRPTVTTMILWVKPESGAQHEQPSDQGADPDHPVHGTVVEKPLEERTHQPGEGAERRALERHEDERDDQRGQVAAHVIAPQTAHQRPLRACGPRAGPRPVERLRRRHGGAAWLRMGEGSGKASPAVAACCSTVLRDAVIAHKRGRKRLG